MKAVSNTQYGAPEVLKVIETQRPHVGDRQILVRVHASTVTQGDRRLRAADFPGSSALFGRLVFGVFAPRHRIGGTDFAGRVVAVGAEVTRFAVGDDVFGAGVHGAYAEYIAVAEDSPVTHMANGSTYPEAAALPYGAVTALTYLRDLAKVSPGDRVLVVGAAGGVGRMAVQIAKHLGAEVTAVCGEGERLVRELGAREVLDYRREHYSEQSRQWDVIFDTLEGNHFSRDRAVLKPGGRYLSLYLSMRLLWQMGTTALGRGQKALATVAMGTAELMQDIRQLAERGALKPVIAQRFALTQIVEAHHALDTSARRGTVVVDVLASQGRLSPVGGELSLA